MDVEEIGEDGWPELVGTHDMDGEEIGEDGWPELVGTHDMDGEEIGEDGWPELVGTHDMDGEEIGDEGLSHPRYLSKEWMLAVHFGNVGLDEKETMLVSHFGNWRKQRMKVVAIEDLTEATSSDIESAVSGLVELGRVPADVSDLFGTDVKGYWRCGLLYILGSGARSQVSSLSLHGQNGFRMSDSEALALCVNLRSNQTLHSLSLNFQRVFGSISRYLGQALKTNSALKELRLPYTDLSAEAVECLMSGLVHNTTLELLDIGYNPKIGDKGLSFVEKMMVATTCRLKTLQLHETGSGLEGAKLMSNALWRNQTVEMFTFGGNDIGKVGMKELLMPLTPGKSLEEALSIRPNTTIKRLELDFVNPASFHTESVASMISTNKTLSHLSLAGAPLLPADWMKEILPALKDNDTLKHLSLWKAEGLSGDDVYDDLMDLVNRNTTLEEINLRDTDMTMKEGAIKEELRLNKEFRSKLKDQRKVPAKSGRIVLCGYEFSGKTTVCNTMRRINHGTPWPHLWKMAWKNLMSKVPACRKCLYGELAYRELEDRTRGIDIVLLREEQDRRVLAWDFAGQKEYYALHDHLFPNSRNSCFVYVCNPRFSPSHHKAGKLKAYKDLRDELLFWMKFIASNNKPLQASQEHGGVLPYVAFVLTNKDRSDAKSLDQCKQWAEQVVRELMGEFKDVISFEKSVYVVDATSCEDVKPLLDKMESKLTELLEKPTEYAVCEQVRLALTNWATRSENRTKPVMTMQDFYSICRREVAEEEYRTASLASKDGQETVLAYLSDVGEIVFTRELGFIVVNPRWFGVGVLGSLIDAFGQPATHWRGVLGYLNSLFRVNQRPTLALDGHGFVSKEQIKGLLQTSLQTLNLMQAISVDDLIALMIQLEMCFEEKPGAPDSRLFVPVLFDDPGEKAAKGTRQLCWKLQRDKHVELIKFGRRLVVANKSHTFLTPGFFPRAQVHLLNHIHKEDPMWTQTPGFQVDKNLLGFAENGIDVMVEYSGDIAYFVDVLVQSSRPHSESLQFVKEHVISRIIEFCATPQGCQGVILEEEVIRPVCVNNLTLCEERKHQAASVSELKQRAEKRKDYLWTWQERIPNIPDQELAFDLLHGKGADINVTQREHDHHAGSSSQDGGLIIQLPQRRYLTPDDIYKLELELIAAKAESSYRVTLNDDECYAAGQDPTRGVALLISMEKGRTGGGVDRGRLEVLARDLGFRVDKKYTLVDNTAASLKRNIKAIAQSDIPAGCEGFLCFVCAHGGTKDGEQLIVDEKNNIIWLLKDIMMPFRKCPQLHGKPKVFFVNACRCAVPEEVEEETPQGEAPQGETPQVETPQGETPQGETPQGETPQGDLGTPQEQDEGDEPNDCLVVFSTSENAPSTRYHQSGSPFVQALVEVFIDKREQWDLLSMTCRFVNRVVEMGKESKRSQCPVTMHSLRKLLYWRQRAPLPR